jgi:GH15 family glucan-1,4-alpha-glucosidase
MMAGTQPSALSTPALYLSNWADMVASWQSRQLTATAPTQAPGLRELHYLGGPRASWSASQIIDHAGFFRDETGGHLYTDAAKFDTEAWFEHAPAQAGVLTTRYLTYRTAQTQPGAKIARSYVGVPGQPLFVIRYDIANTTNGTLEFNVLDQVHVNNLAPGTPVHGFYDNARNALFADMRASGQFVVVLGALQAADGHQVGDDNNSTIGAADIDPWSSFQHDGTLRGNGDVQTPDVDLAFNNRLTLAAGASQQLFFYLTVRPDLVSAQAAADAARAQSGSAWFAQTAATYVTWLAAGGRARQPGFADTGLTDHFQRALIAIKNLQNPVVGTFAASTNPYSYGHKNWVRDGSITAIALDASGRRDEAERYWRWMASVQGSDGTWKTTYNTWDGTYMSFVEPEYDSSGQFIYGVYRHYEETGDSTFLHDLYPTAKRAADSILGGLSSTNGLGAPDFSIWEEPERGLEHNSFTQAWYVAGLYAMQCLAEIRGDTALSDWYAGGPGSIVTALQRRADAGPPGMWNPDGYYNRAVNPDDSVQPLADTSSNLLIALGVIDPLSGRGGAHIGTMLTNLTKHQYGLARYADDIYYVSSRFNPAKTKFDPGNEAGHPEPPWPQLSMWVAVYETLVGDKDNALKRMQWFTSTTGAGYMPQGEALNSDTAESVLSSMSEPLTASSFLLAALVLDGLLELRILPPIYQAGAHRTLAMTAGTAGDGINRDWEQWDPVPYYVASIGAAAQAMTTISRVYISNDAANFYLRVDNVSQTLSDYATVPTFALRVYSQDFANSGALGAAWGLDREPIHRTMSFAVERRSDENNLRRWSINAGAWDYDSDVPVGLAPQWDPATGRLEAVIPIPAFSSQPISPGSSAWAAIAVALAAHDPATNNWTDGPKVLIHYRLTDVNQPWLYGNVEQ